MLDPLLYRCPQVRGLSRPLVPGLGKAQSSRLIFPAYLPGLGSYSRAGLRLFYSAGNPTWRIDPMSFTCIQSSTLLNQ